MRFQVYCLQKAQKTPEGLDVAIFSLDKMLQDIASKVQHPIDVGISNSNDFPYPLGVLLEQTLQSCKTGTPHMHTGPKDLGMLRQEYDLIEDEFLRLYGDRGKPQLVTEWKTMQESIKTMGSKSVFEHYVRESLKEIAIPSKREDEEQKLQEFTDFYFQGLVPDAIPDMKFLRCYQEIWKKTAMSFQTEVINNISEAKEKLLEKVKHNLFQKHLPLYHAARLAYKRKESFAIARINVYDGSDLGNITREIEIRSLIQTTLRRDI